MSHLQITAVDTEGRRVHGPITALLTPAQGSARRASGPNPLAIAGLATGPSIPFRCQVSAPGYCTVGRLVNVGANVQLETFVLPVDADKVVGTIFPGHVSLPRDVQTLVSPERYEAISDEERAGLLNITTKLRAEGLLSSVSGVYIPKRDRIIAWVSPMLWETVSTSPKFKEVSGSLHQAPEGWFSAKSFKTGEPAGNLQVTFFRRGVEWMADIDIDDAGGFAHTFQVVRNAVTRETTHPYNIHEILRMQGLDPGYSLSPL